MAARDEDRAEENSRAAPGDQCGDAQLNAVPNSVVCINL